MIVCTNEIRKIKIPKTRMTGAVTLWQCILGMAQTFAKVYGAMPVKSPSRAVSDDKIMLMFFMMFLPGGFD